MPLAPGPATTTARGIVKLLGDFDPSSTADLPIFGSLSGASPCNITPATLQWLAATASPTIKQATCTSDVAPSDMHFRPQLPFATATTNKTAGNIKIHLGNPVSGGNLPYFYIIDDSVSLPCFAAGNASPGGNYGKVWIGSGAAAPSASNHVLSYDIFGETYLNATSNVIFTIAGGQVGVMNYGGYWCPYGIQIGGVFPATYGGGTGGILTLTNAATNPSSSISGASIVYSEKTTGHLKSRGGLAGITTIAPSGSSGTVNSQAQVFDTQFGTCETVSSSTATSILAYTTTSGKAGLMTVVVISRATTTGTGIAVGDAAMSTYTLGYKNVGGTVTLSTAGLTLVGAAQTTAAALTTSLTATVSGAVITLSVTNVSLCTVDSQVDASVAVC